MLEIATQDPNGYHFGIKMAPEMGKSRRPSSERLGFSVPQSGYFFQGRKMDDAQKQVYQQISTQSTDTRQVNISAEALFQHHQNSSMIVHQIPILPNVTLSSQIPPHMQQLDVEIRNVTDKFRNELNTKCEDDDKLQKNRIKVVEPNNSKKSFAETNCVERTSTKSKNVKRLEAVLKNQGCYETKQGLERRREVLKNLNILVRQWIQSVSLNSGMHWKLVDRIGGRIVTYGSYMLGVSYQGADIDALCIAPQNISRQDYFTTFYDLLRYQQQVTELRKIEDAFVPVLKMRFNGIEIDMTFARLNEPEVPCPATENMNFLEYSGEHQPLSKDMKLVNLDPKCIRSLNGYRSTVELVKLVPNIDMFRLVLRAIKLWAKSQGLYSNILGYLGGFSWAVLVAKVCVEYHDLDAAQIILKFFQYFATWPWPNPVTLKNIETNQEESNDADLSTFAQNVGNLTAESRPTIITSNIQHATPYFPPQALQPCCYINGALGACSVSNGSPCVPIMVSSSNNQIPCPQVMAYTASTSGMTYGGGYIISSAGSGTSLPSWNPDKNINERYQVMPIITPTYPHINSSFNVTENTKQLIQRKMLVAAETCDKIMKGDVKWDSLFNTCHMFHEYEHFLIVIASADATSDHIKWFGLIESKIRHLVNGVEKDCPIIASARIWPKPFTKITEKTQKITQLWFIGLEFRTPGITEFDYQRPLQSFQQVLQIQARLFYKPDMRLEAHSLPKTTLTEHLTELEIQEIVSSQSQKTSLPIIPVTPPSPSTPSHTPIDMDQTNNATPAPLRLQNIALPLEKRACVKVKEYESYECSKSSQVSNQDSCEEQCGVCEENSTGSEETNQDTDSIEPSNDQPKNSTQENKCDEQQNSSSDLNSQSLKATQNKTKNDSPLSSPKNVAQNLHGTDDGEKNCSNYQSCRSYANVVTKSACNLSPTSGASGCNENDKSINNVGASGGRTEANNIHYADSVRNMSSVSAAHEINTKMSPTISQSFHHETQHFVATSAKQLSNNCTLKGESNNNTLAPDHPIFTHNNVDGMACQATLAGHYLANKGHHNDQVTNFSNNLHTVPPLMISSHQNAHMQQNAQSLMHTMSLAARNNYAPSISSQSMHQAHHYLPPTYSHGNNNSNGGNVTGIVESNSSSSSSSSVGRMSRASSQQQTHLVNVASYSVPIPNISFNNGPAARLGMNNINHHSLNSSLNSTMRTPIMERTWVSNNTTGCITSSTTMNSSMPRSPSAFSPPSMHFPTLSSVTNQRNSNEHANFGNRRMNSNGNNGSGLSGMNHNMTSQYGNGIPYQQQKGYLVHSNMKHYHQTRSPYNSMRSQHNSSSGSSMSSNGSRSSPHSPKTAMGSVNHLPASGSQTMTGRKDRYQSRKKEGREMHNTPYAVQGSSNLSSSGYHKKHLSVFNSCDSESDFVHHAIGQTGQRGNVVRSSTRKNIDGGVIPFDSGGSCSSAGGLLDNSVDWNYSGMESENGRSVSFSSDHLPPQVLRDSVFHHSDKVPYSPLPQSVSASSNCLPSVISNSNATSSSNKTTNPMIQCDMTVPPPSPMPLLPLQRNLASVSKGSYGKNNKGSGNKARNGNDKSHAKIPKPVINISSNRFSLSEIRDVSTPLPIEAVKHKNIQFNFNDTSMLQKNKKSPSPAVTASSGIPTLNTSNPSSDSVFN